jgi:hypothetical protein
MTMMSRLPHPRRVPYAGPDMPLDGTWTAVAESHLRGLVVQQRECIQWLERELARTHAFFHRAVGE